jgi:hypothetical protein
MRIIRLPLFLAALVAAVVTADLPDARASSGAEVRKGRVELTAGAAATAGAKGRIDADLHPARGSHDESARLRIKLEHLAGATAYTLWGTNPATATLAQFGEVTTKQDGNAEFKIDTKRGDALPFGATLEGLAGGSVEVHDAAGGVVFSGNFPDLFGHKGPPLKARADLEAPAGAPFADAKGRIDVRFENPDSHHAARSRLKIKVEHLGRSSHYTLWVNGTQFGELTTKGDGNAEFKVDTKKGDELPLGVTLEQLAGATIEVRDDSGAVVLTGTFPSLQPEHGDHVKDRNELTSTVAGAKGRVEAEFKAADAHHAEESKLTIKVEHLSGDTEYTLWGTNPATGTVEQFGTLTTKSDGNAEFKVETKKGDALPFGATLADLAGGTLEVRDSSGTAVLTGTFPDIDAGGSAPPPPPPTNETGHVDLTPVLAGATGSIDTASTATGSTITIAMAGLTPNTAYSLWTFNPTTLAIETFGSVTTDASGAAQFTVDTSAGGSLPFGTSLDALAGGSFEVHDPAAVVVLAGTFPSTQ